MYASVCKRMALLACVGMIIPQGTIVGAEKTEKQQTVRMLDVKLASSGKLSGQVVDAQGRALAGTTVSVRYANRVVATTKTNAQGRYAIQGLRGGVHQLQTVNGRIPARFWTAETAPSSARTNALIVSDKNVIRAQCGEPTCCAPGAKVTCGNSCGHWVEGNCCNPCCQEDDCGLLMCGLVMAGVVTAIVIAADDDDDDNSSP